MYANMKDRNKDTTSIFITSKTVFKFSLHIEILKPV